MPSVDLESASKIHCRIRIRKCRAREGVTLDLMLAELVAYFQLIKHRIRKWGRG